MTNLLDSFFLDRNYRWTTYAVSGLFSISYASINVLVLHRNNAEVCLEAAILFCLFLGLGIRLRAGLRKLSPETLPEISPPPSEPREIYSHYIAILLSVAFVFGIAVHGNVIPKLQAIVIDARLERIDHPLRNAYTFQTPEQRDAALRSKFRQLEAIADTADRYQIPVYPSTVLKAKKTIQTSLAQSAISPQTREEGLIASARFVDLAALWKTQGNTARPGLIMSSNLSITDTNVRYLGEHTPVVSDGEGFIIRNSTVVFDGIDFAAPQPFAGSPFTFDSKSVVVVRNGTITNFDQILDGITWANVQFHHSMIKFKGGPLALVNVRFIDCDLRWISPDVPFGGAIGNELYKKIMQANGQPINFAFEGNLDRNRKPE
jgi:hypothetical protein